MGPLASGGRKLAAAFIGEGEVDPAAPRKQTGCTQGPPEPAPDGLSCEGLEPWRPLG